MSSLEKNFSCDEMSEDLQENCFCVVKKTWLKNKPINERLAIVESVNLVQRSSTNHNDFHFCSAEWLKQQFALKSNERTTIRVVGTHANNKDLGIVELLLVADTQAECDKYVKENIKKGDQNLGRGKREKIETTKDSTPQIERCTKSMKIKETSTVERKKKSLKRRKNLEEARTSAKLEQEDHIAAKIKRKVPADKTHCCDDDEDNNGIVDNTATSPKDTDQVKQLKIGKDDKRRSRNEKEKKNVVENIRSGEVHRELKEMTNARNDIDTRKIVGDKPTVDNTAEVGSYTLARIQPLKSPQQDLKCIRQSKVIKQSNEFDDIENSGNISSSSLKTLPKRMKNALKTRLNNNSWIVETIVDDGKKFPTEGRMEQVTNETAATTTMESEATKAAKTPTPIKMNPVTKRDANNSVEATAVGATIKEIATQSDCTFLPDLRPKESTHSRTMMLKMITAIKKEKIEKKPNVAAKTHADATTNGKVKKPGREDDRTTDALTSQGLKMGEEKVLPRKDEGKKNQQRLVADSRESSCKTETSKVTEGKRTRQLPTVISDVIAQGYDILPLNHAKKNVGLAITTTPLRCIAVIDKKKSRTKLQTKIEEDYPATPQDGQSKTMKLDTSQSNAQGDDDMLEPIIGSDANDVDNESINSEGSVEPSTNRTGIEDATVDHVNSNNGLSERSDVDWKKQYLLLNIENNGLKEQLKAMNRKTANKQDEGDPSKTDRDHEYKEEVREKLDYIIDRLGERQENQLQVFQRQVVMDENGKGWVTVGNDIRIPQKTAYDIFATKGQKERFNLVINFTWPLAEQVFLYLSEKHMPADDRCRVVTVEEYKKMQAIMDHYEAIDVKNDPNRPLFNVTDRESKKRLSHHFTWTRDLHHPDKREATLERQRQARIRRKECKDGTGSGRTPGVNAASSNGKSKGQRRTVSEDVVNSVIYTMEEILYDGENDLTKRSRTMNNLTLHKIGRDLKIKVGDLRKILTPNAFIFQEGGKYRYPVEFAYEISELGKAITHAIEQEMENDVLKRTEMRALFENATVDNILIDYLIEKYTIEAECQESSQRRTTGQHERMLKFNRKLIAHSLLITVVNNCYEKEEKKIGATKSPVTFSVQSMMKRLSKLPLCEDHDEASFVNYLRRQRLLDEAGDRGKADADGGDKKELTFTISNSLTAQTHWRYIVRRNVVNVLSK